MTTIAFLGAGNIASAIMGGLIDNDFEPSKLIAHDPVDECRDRAAALGVTIAADNDDAIRQADIVMLCVKPDILLDMLTNVQADVTGKLFVSVAAGITSAAMAAHLPSGTAIIRCMPNTPALVQTGMTGMYANAEVTKSQRANAESVLSAVGKSLWLSSETDLDAVTAVSGSGPAYFFYLMEAMINAAIEQGLTTEVANELVLQTALGAAKMATMSDVDPATLRKRVTSPGGTTQAAIETMQQADLPKMVGDAIAAAKHRSEALSGS